MASFPMPPDLDDSQISLPQQQPIAPRTVPTEPQHLAPRPPTSIFQDTIPRSMITSSQQPPLLASPPPLNSQMPQPQMPQQSSGQGHVQRPYPIYGNYIGRGPIFQTAEQQSASQEKQAADPQPGPDNNQTQILPRYGHSEGAHQAAMQQIALIRNNQLRQQQGDGQNQLQAHHEQQAAQQNISQVSQPAQPQLRPAFNNDRGFLYGHSEGAHQAAMQQMALTRNNQLQLHQQAEVQRQSQALQVAPQTASPSIQIAQPQPQSAFNNDPMNGYVHSEAIMQRIAFIRQQKLQQQQAEVQIKSQAQQNNPYQQQIPSGPQQPQPMTTPQEPQNATQTSPLRPPQGNSLLEQQRHYIQQILALKASQVNSRNLPQRGLVLAPINQQSQGNSQNVPQGPTLNPVNQQSQSNSQNVPPEGPRLVLPIQQQQQSQYQPSPLRQPPLIANSPPRTPSPPLYPPFPQPTRTTCPAYPPVFCCGLVDCPPGHPPMASKLQFLLTGFSKIMKHDTRTFPVLSSDLVDASFVFQVSEKTDFNLLRSELIRRGFMRFYVLSRQSTGEKFAEVQGGIDCLLLLYSMTGGRITVSCGVHRREFVVELLMRAFVPRWLEEQVVVVGEGEGEGEDMEGQDGGGNKVSSDTVTRSFDEGAVDPRLY